MIGLGTIANTIAVIIGGCIGLFLKKGIKKSLQDSLLQAMGPYGERFHHLLCFFCADLDAGDGHGEGEPENDQHAGIVPQEIRQTADHRAAHGRRSGGADLFFWIITFRKFRFTISQL